MSATRTVALRCEHAPRMFAKLVVKDVRIVSGNLIEFSCRECKSRTPGAQKVLHRFDLAGNLVESEIIRTEETR